MKLSAPKVFTFWIAVAFAVIGVIFLFIPAVRSIATIIVLIGFVLLVLGNILKGW